MKFWALISNNKIGTAIGAVVFSAVAFNSCVASEKDTLVDLAGITKQMQEFHPYYSNNKAIILAKEKGYIDIAEKPEEHLQNRNASRKIIRDTKRFIDDLDNDMSDRIKVLDELTSKADEFCSANEDASFEADCIKLYDNIQMYEAEVSTYTAMIEVMHERYEEAKAVLK